MASTPSEGSSQKSPERDRWSKAQVIIVPLSVAAVGFFGSNYLSKRQELDTRARVYAELISQREQAESALRKDMFVSIIEPFLKPEKTSRDVQVLDMELLAYNFHESLNLKPLFAYLRRTISESEEPDTKKKKLLSRLERVASDVADKQLLVLAEVGQQFNSTINLKAVRDHPPTEDGPSQIGTLTLNGIERIFQLVPTAVDFDSHELECRLEILTTETSEKNSYTFSVGFYDFPMIDNTRLTHDQRCAVVLRGWQEDTQSAEATVICFPGSRASLKDKPFLEDVIANLQATPASNTKK
jgi:hypothetical protein